MVTDPISDMLIRIKNASMVGKKSLVVPHSKIKYEIAKILKREGYLTELVRRGKKVKKSIYMEIAYSETGKPKFNEVKRISKPSKRIYQGFKDIKRVRQGHGLSVISTPSGLLLDREARKEKVGGEVLFALW